MVKNKIRLIIFFAAEEGETIQSVKTRPGADCGSDHQLLIAKFRLKKALGRPRGMEWGGRREEGSGWGTHVYLWRIHLDTWQN